MSQVSHIHPPEGAFCIPARFNVTDGGVSLHQERYKILGELDGASSANPEVKTGKH
jgi:hypothetical protein